MKNLMILILVTIFISCSSDGDLKEIERNIIKGFSTKDFVDAKVAYKFNDDVKLAIKEIDLIKSFNNHSKKVKLGKVALKLEVLNIENEYYVRFYNEDKSVSTVALISNLNNTENQIEAKLMQLGNTVCTTEDCANCCGCVPKGDYCTLCELNSNDCARTTSG